MGEPRRREKGSLGEVGFSFNMQREMRIWGGNWLLESAPNFSFKLYFNCLIDHPFSPCSTAQSIDGHKKENPVVFSYHSDKEVIHCFSRVSCWKKVRNLEIMVIRVAFYYFEL